MSYINVRKTEEKKLLKFTNNVEAKEGLKIHKYFKSVHKFK